MRSFASPLKKLTNMPGLLNKLICFNKLLNIALRSENDLSGNWWLAICSPLVRGASSGQTPNVERDGPTTSILRSEGPSGQKRRTLSS